MASARCHEGGEIRENVVPFAQNLRSFLVLSSIFIILVVRVHLAVAYTTVLLRLGRHNSGCSPLWLRHGFIQVWLLA